MSGYGAQGGAPPEALAPTGDAGAPCRTAASEEPLREATVATASEAPSGETTADPDMSRMPSDLSRTVTPASPSRAPSSASVAAWTPFNATASSPYGDAYLVNHGSFNPPHRGHIHMMVAAKERVEAEGYRVTHGFMCITKAGWIHGKGVEALKDDIRVQCCNLLAADMGQDWVTGDIRGITVKSGGDMLRTHFHKERSGKGFNVIGGDLAARIGRRPNGNPVVVIGREGSPLPEEGLAEGDGPMCVVKTEANTGGFSSTRARKAIADKDDDLLEDLIGAQQRDLLLELGDSVWVKSDGVPDTYFKYT